MPSMKVVLVPLGLRCNAAMVVNSIVKQARLPFDWTQMNVESMSKVIHLQKSDSKDFWTSYFTQLDISNHHKQTQSWFPHDTFTTETEKATSVEKYVRRTERLLTILDNNDTKIFVIFFGFPEYGNMEKTLALIKSIESRVVSPHFFIVCNATFNEGYISNCFYLYEKLDSEDKDENAPWNDLNERVSIKIKEILMRLNAECMVVPNTDQTIQSIPS